MSAAMRRAAGWAFAAVVTLALVGLSRVPYAQEHTSAGELRLAWRFKSEQVRRCRTLTPAELEKLPAHMRQAQDCQRGLRPYRLEIVVDGLGAGDDTIRARGAESDRPLFVFRRIRVELGDHAVSVRFSPVGGGGPPLALDTTVTVGARRVALVTMDEDAGRLVVRTALPRR